MKAAIKLQSIVRGLRLRSSDQGKKVDAAVKKKEELHESEKKDDVVRKSRWFKARATFGFAPKLETDTDDERAKGQISLARSTGTIFGKAALKVTKAAGKKASESIKKGTKLAGGEILLGIAGAISEDTSLGKRLLKKAEALLEVYEEESNPKAT